MSMVMWSYSSPQCYHLEGRILEVSAESVKYLNYLISKSSSNCMEIHCHVSLIIITLYTFKLYTGIILVWMICCVCVKYYMLCIRIISLIELLY